MRDTVVIMVNEISVPQGVMVVAIAAVAIVAVEIEEVAIVVVAIVAAVGAEATQAGAVAGIEGRRKKPLNQMNEVNLRGTEAKPGVKITSQVRNPKRVIKVENLKAGEIIVAAVNQIIRVEMVEEEINHSSSIIFSFIFEKIPLSSKI
tara:strand:- start:93 stop:536 length:444 start_codon:yes stop_codon:yes gene_type:complete